MRKLLLAAAMLLLASSSFAEGLLGQRYAGVNLEYNKFGGEAGDLFDNGGWGYGGVVNLPVHDMIDVQPVLGYNFGYGTGDVTTDRLFGGGRVFVHGCKEQVFNPFVVGGVLFNRINVVGFDDGSYYQDSSASYEAGLGFEYSITDKFLVRPTATWEKFNDAGDPDYRLSLLLGGWVTDTVFLGLTPAYLTDSYDRSITANANFKF